MFCVGRMSSFSAVVENSIFHTQKRLFTPTYVTYNYRLRKNCSLNRILDDVKVSGAQQSMLQT